MPINETALRQYEEIVFNKTPVTYASPVPFNVYSESAGANWNHTLHIKKKLLHRNPALTVDSGIWIFAFTAIQQLSVTNLETTFLADVVLPPGVYEFFSAKVNDNAPGGAVTAMIKRLRYVQDTTIRGFIHLMVHYYDLSSISGTPAIKVFMHAPGEAVIRWVPKNTNGNSIYFPYLSPVSGGGYSPFIVFKDEYGNDSQVWGAFPGTGVNTRVSGGAIYIGESEYRIITPAHVVFMYRWDVRTVGLELSWRIGS